MPRIVSAIILFAALGGVCHAQDIPLSAQTLAPCHPWGASFTPMPVHCRDFRFVALPAVTFATDRAELAEAARTTLDIAARYILADPSVRRVLVRGHTDEVGPTARNNPLADRRAAAVRDYLVAHGVPAEFLVLQGYGEAQPTDENWTVPGRARNRRVELYAIHWTNTMP